MELNVIYDELSNKIVEDMHPQQVLLSSSLLKEKYRYKIELLMENYIQQLITGITALNDTLKILSREKSTQFPVSLIEELEKITTMSPPNEKSTLSLKDHYQMSEQTLNSYYQAANENVIQKNYQNARDILILLCTLDPQNILYWQGLGNVEYFCENYEEGLHAYSLAYLLNTQDPNSLLYGAHCVEKLGDKKKAQEMAHSVVDICESEEDLNELAKCARDYEDYLMSA